MKTKIAYFNTPDVNEGSAVYYKPTKPTLVPPLWEEPDYYRYTSCLRDGKISYEVFCKRPERRKQLGLPVIIPEV